MKTIIFGSILEKDFKDVNDIDIAIIVPNGTVEYYTNQFVEKIVSKHLEDLYFIDRLLKYDKFSPTRKKSQFFHILFCEEKDLESNHPIIDSLNKGIEIKFAA